MDEIITKVGFALRNITTEQFAIIEECFDSEKEINISTSLKFGLDKETKVIAVYAAFKFEQKKCPFLVLDISCQFGVDDETWINFLNNETQEFKAPKQFIQHLVVLTIGTARGVLHSKTENTPFNKYFLPTINVNNLVKEDISIKL